MRLRDVFLSIAAGLLGYPFFMSLTFLLDFFVGEKALYWRIKFGTGDLLLQELLNDWKSTLPIFMIISLIMMLLYSFFRDNRRAANISLMSVNIIVFAYLIWMGLSFFILLFSFLTLLLFTYTNGFAKKKD